MWIEKAAYLTVIFFSFISLFSGEIYLERAALWAQLLFLKLSFFSLRRFLLLPFDDRRSGRRIGLEISFSLSFYSSWRNFQRTVFFSTTCYVSEHFLILNAPLNYATRINQLIALPKKEKKINCRTDCRKKRHIFHRYILLLLLWRHLQMAKEISTNTDWSRARTYSWKNLSQEPKTSLCFEERNKSSSYLSEAITFYNNQTRVIKELGW